ncbi:hypothetical protein [Nocardiopsis sp. NPDC058789]|uniref:Uncharacterized protein n=1 Tax=Nocardiopsis eucommiae TaxID=2831970 RepID=A0A975LCM7_9ACTN|nr:hypothetical protein KGD82_11365 [Nocardiopsis eucommiae]
MRHFAPCSGLLVLALLSTPAQFTERLVASSPPPTPPSVGAPFRCSGRLRVPRPRRPPRCGYH